MAKPQNSTNSTTALTQQQSELIVALVAGATITDAAQKAGCDRGTYYQWLRDPEFEAELNRAKLERANVLRTQIRDLADTAVSTLREMLTGTDIPPGIKLKAALTVLQCSCTLTPETVGLTDASQIRLAETYLIPGIS